MLDARKFAPYIFVIFHFISFSIDALWLGDCNKPLGISTGTIPDSALTASSSHDMIVGPHRARLGRDYGGGAWCPRGMVDKNQLEFIEVDLGNSPRLVTGVGTQGRFANNFGVEYTPAFTVEFMRPGTTHFHPFAIPPGSNETLLFVGNTDTFTEIKNEFELPLFASRVRIRPISVHPRVVCLRFELYGCNYTESLDHYEIEGRSETYEVGEGLLFDGSVTTSFFLEGDSNSASEAIAKVKRSIHENQIIYDFQNIPLNHTGEETNVTLSDSGTKQETSKSPDEIEETLAIPVIPAGEIVAPEIPLNVTFIFNKILNFSKIYIYIDPIHPLIAGAHPLLMISMNFGLDSLTWMEPVASINFPLQREAQNITIEAKGRSAQILQLYLTVDHAEINIQEVYFQSDNCDCIFKAKSTPIPPQVPKSVLFTSLTSSEVSNNKKSENFISEEAPLRITSDEKTKTKTFGETNREVETTERAIKIIVEKGAKSGKSGKSAKSASKTPSHKQTEVTSVWAVHTVSTHRTYVGVAIGFSVGVGVLLCVWIYLWAKSGRSKVSSPRIFRRSPPQDTLDMACLMDGNLTDFGIVTPTNDDYNELAGTCSRSFIVKGPSDDAFRPQKSEHISKFHDDLPNAPLVSPVSSNNNPKIKTSFYNGRSIYYGHSMPKDTDYEIYKKPNLTKNQISIFSKAKRNISAIKPDATFARYLSEYRHQPDISFISSESGRSVYSSWDMNVNTFDFPAFSEDNNSKKRLQF